MLSIIVSSYQQHYFEQFSENVKSTIGNNFEYEIIQQWNPNEMGICEAYNKGVDKAKYDYLLFVHEDVVFETHDWGNILINNLKRNEIGCVGLAGSSVKTLFPIAWWDISKSKLIHINQLTSLRGVETYRVNKLEKVKIIDGVFIGVSKHVWKDVKFNNNNDSFHGYDIEFSLKISENYQNLITNEILLTHLSEGKLSKQWFQEIIKIYTNIKYYNVKVSVEEVKIFFNYLKMFPFSNKDKVLIFFKFYNPLNFSILNNLRIVKILLSNLNLIK